LGITSNKNNKKSITNNETQMDVKDVIKLQAEKKRKEQEAKMKEVVLKVPNSNPNEKPLKALLQKPKIQESSKCSHNRRVIFNQDVQIFYRDADIVIGVEGKLQDNEHKKDFESMDQQQTQQQTQQQQQQEEEEQQNQESITEIQEK